MMWRFVMLVAAAGALAPAHASAQSPFYVGVTGGAAFFLDQDVDVDFLGVDDGANVDFDYDTGYQFTGKVGYRVDTNIRVEGEFGYTQADVERGFEFNLLNIDNETDQELRILSFTGGVFLDLWPVGTFVPYVGGGIGYANIEIDNENLDSIDQNVFTTFAETGLPFALTPALSIVPSVRFSWYLTKEKQSEGATVIADDLYSTQAQIGLNYSF